jgi:hypothetical protein
VWGLGSGGQADQCKYAMPINRLHWSCLYILHTFLG